MRDVTFRAGAASARYGGRVLLTEDEVDRIAGSSPGAERFQRRERLLHRRHLQLAGLHETAYSTGDVDQQVRVCTCGRLCPIGVDPTAAAGHRAVPGMADVVDVVAVTGPHGTDRLVCQRRGHQEGALSEDEVLHERARHGQVCQRSLPWASRGTDVR